MSAAVIKSLVQRIKTKPSLNICYEELWLSAWNQYRGHNLNLRLTQKMSSWYGEEMGLFSTRWKRNNCPWVSSQVLWLFSLYITHLQRENVLILGQTISPQIPLGEGEIRCWAELLVPRPVVPSLSYPYSSQGRHESPRLFHFQPGMGDVQPPEEGVSSQDFLGGSSKESLVLSTAGYEWMAWMQFPVWHGTRGEGTAPSRMHLLL